MYLTLSYSLCSEKQLYRSDYFCANSTHSEESRTFGRKFTFFAFLHQAPQAPATKFLIDDRHTNERRVSLTKRRIYFHISTVEAPGSYTISYRHARKHKIKKKHKPMAQKMFSFHIRKLKSVAPPRNEAYMLKGFFTDREMGPPRFSLRLTHRDILITHKSPTTAPSCAFFRVFRPKGAVRPTHGFACFLHMMCSRTALYPSSKVTVPSQVKSGETPEADEYRTSCQ